MKFYFLLTLWPLQLSTVFKMWILKFIFFSNFYIENIELLWTDLFFLRAQAWDIILVHQIVKKINNFHNLLHWQSCGETDMLIYCWFKGHER